MAKLTFRAALRRKRDELRREYLQDPKRVQKAIIRGGVGLLLLAVFWLPLVKMTFATVIHYGMEESVGTIIDGHPVIGLLDWTRWCIIALMIVVAEYFFIMRQVTRLLTTGDFGVLMLSFTGREPEENAKFPGEH